jgi:hypothetical protein
VFDDSREISGYATPDALREQALVLDKLIRELDQVVSNSKAPRIDQRFREAFRQWTQRWVLFRSESDAYSARLLSPLETEERLGHWRDSYQRWLAEVQQRTRLDLPMSDSPKSPETLSQELEPITRPLSELRSSQGTAVLAGVALALGGLVLLRFARR